MDQKDLIENLVLIEEISMLSNAYDECTKTKHILILYGDSIPDNVKEYLLNKCIDKVNLVTNKVYVYNRNNYIQVLDECKLDIGRIVKQKFGDKIYKNIIKKMEQDYE